MYKLFVVDDEVVIRESIRTQIDWDNMKFTLSGEASDGEMALSLIKDIKPDILLTDIRMPFMDGLELARIVKQTMPWMRIIILSGHDEFKYAQSAIAIGVQDYLLKPINARELLSAIEKAAEDIEESAKERENITFMKTMLHHHARESTQLFFTDILNGNVDDDIVERGLSLGIDLSADHYVVALIELSGDDATSMLLARGIISYIVGENTEVNLAFDGIERIIAIVTGVSEEMVIERAYSFARAVQHEVSELKSIPAPIAVGIGIGGTIPHISSVQTSYLQAVQVFKRLAGAMEGKIYSFVDISGDTVALLPENLPRAEQLRCAVSGDISEIISRLLKSIEDKPVISVNLANYLLLDLLITCTQLLKDAGCNAEMVLPEINNIAELSLPGATREDLARTMEDILARTISARDECSGTKYAPVIRKALAYINENYADPNISLQTAAKSIALSGSHFCTIFAQETGQTFIEHLTSVRINKAKDLLTNLSLHTSEISYAVGYNDPRYFSYIFKKQTGLTPRSFRRQLNDEQI